MLRAAYLVLRAMRRINQRQRDVLTNESAYRLSRAAADGGARRCGQAAAETSREVRAAATPRDRWNRCGSPCARSLSVWGAEIHVALQIALQPFRVAGASCAAGSLSSLPSFPEHSRPSLPFWHRRLQWDFCKILPRMIYDTPSANF